MDVVLDMANVTHKVCRSKLSSIRPDSNLTAVRELNYTSLSDLCCNTVDGGFCFVADPSV